METLGINIDWNTACTLGTCDLCCSITGFIGLLDYQTYP